MARYGSDRNRIEGDQLQATEHPVRLMIVQLFTRNRLRPMEAAVLAIDLLTEFPDLKAEEVRPANVAYHVAVLKDAELLPSGAS
jgi:hypothetical protein